MQQVKVFFFGAFKATKPSGEKIALHGRKTSALLAYLAVSKKEENREALEALFWPDLPQKAAKNNLRVALARISKSLSQAEQPLLRTDRQTVQLNPEAPVEIDIQTFEQGISSSQTHKHTSRESCASCCDELHETVDLYQAEFMKGLFLEDCEVFNDWLTLTRERFHLDAISVLNDLSTFYEAKGDYSKAETQTRAQLKLEPLSEAAHRRLMRLLSFQDKRNAALGHFQWYQAYLQEELGVEPEDETRALSNKIQARLLEKPTWQNAVLEDLTETVAAELKPTKHNLLNNTTAFFGREDELVQLKEHLLDKRLITLLGIGGTGKTRLATELARSQLNAFRDGVFFLRLTALQNPEDIATVVAEALTINVQQGTDLKGQVLSYLKDKTMLLIMDNFEHLLVGRSFVQDILQTAPAIKIIVTSREKLNLSTEAVYTLSGLSYPTESPSQNEVVHSATQLFLDTAKRARLDFKLDLIDLRHIDEICRIVQGHPLAIVLAAGWLESLSCQEIAQELTEGIEFLETDMHDIPERQRSIRAAFNYSWKLLNKDEQNMYASMSVFKGGFNRLATKHVSGASLKQLTTLLNKSLIQYWPEQGRYELHELMRQFAEEKLKDSGRQDEIRQLHSDCYLSALQNWQRDFQANQEASLKAFEGDFENVRVAWQWAMHNDNHKALEQSVSSLKLLCTLKSRYQTLINLLEPLSTHAFAADESGFELTVLVALGTAYRSIRGYLAPEVKESFERAFEITKSQDASPELFSVLYGLWSYYFVGVDYDQALNVVALWHDRLAKSKAQSEVYLQNAEVVVHHIEGAIRYQMGDFEEAKTILLKAISLYKPSQHQAFVASYGQDPAVFCRHWLSQTYWALGYPDKAAAYSQEARQLASAFEHPFTRVFSLTTVVLISILSQDYESAETYADELYRRAFENNFAYFEPISMIAKGVTQSKEGNDEGFALMEKGLEAFTWSAQKEAYSSIFINELIETANYADALALCNATLTFSKQSQSYCCDAELLRLKALCLEAQSDNAEATYKQGISVAQQQNAKMLELKLSRSYAAFLVKQDRPKEAKKVLQNTYDWFTEGFTSKDLIGAKEQLENLAGTKKARVDK